MNKKIEEQSEIVKKDSIKFQNKLGISYETFFPDSLKTDYDLEKRFEEIKKHNKKKGISNKIYNWYIVQAMNLAKRKNEIRDRIPNSIKRDVSDFLEGIYYFTGLKKEVSVDDLWKEWKTVESSMVIALASKKYIDKKKRLKSTKTRKSV